MATDSREIMLEKFVTVNKVRYPDFIDRLNKVDVDTMQFETIAKDPSNPVIGRMANLASSSLSIKAEEQSWECALVNGDRVLNFSDDTLYATLEEISTTKSRGLYRYKAEGDTEASVVHVLPLISDNVDTIQSAVLADLNDQAKYRIKASELSLVGKVSDTVYNFMIDGDTIYGAFTLVCSDPYTLKAGTWLEGYYGQVLPRDLMSPEAVTSLLGISNDNIIYTGDNLWLKFSYNGKTVLIAQKPTARGLSFNNLADLSLVNGDRVITINGDTYNVRIPTSGVKEDGRNEWESLLYHVSEKDPDKVFWEKFTDAELGVGYTENNQARNMGEWTITTRESTAVEQTMLRGGLAGGITGNTTTSLTTVSNNRGFRPVLILQGVDGISLTPAFDMTEPKRLDPVLHASYAPTDAYPIKRAVLGLSVLAPEYDYATMEAVYGIYQYQIASGEKVHAPLYHYGSITDTIVRIEGVDIELLGKATRPVGYTYDDLIKGLYATPTPQYYSDKVEYWNSAISDVTTPIRAVNVKFNTGRVAATYAYSDLIKGLYNTPAIKLVGKRPSGFSGTTSDVNFPIRQAITRLITPAYKSYSYSDTIKGLNTITVKTATRAPIPSATADYSESVIGLRIYQRTYSSPRALTKSDRPTTQTVPATDYSQLGN